MFSPVEEIKSRLDIVELIQSYIRLQKAGINFRANCPFHGEKTPSFFVSPSRQIWHCFGCGKGGDIFKFIMEIEGHEFPEAMKLLAERAGVVIKRENPSVQSERNKLYDLCEEAAKVFEKSLSLTSAASAYLKKRGIKDETLKEFRIGFAPQSWDFLLKSLSAHGFRKEEITAAGLAIKSEDGTSWYDRFRSRIMFPITDANARVIGFGGRIFESGDLLGRQAGKQQAASNKAQERTEAKYVNTPNTLIYDKSRVLYGFDRAKQEIRAKNQVVMVEGYMDCIMSHQAGVKNTIAVSGTALTPHQLKIIQRLCNTMVSSFDTDVAGESATRRSLGLAAQFDFERKVAVIPIGKDPADAVLENPQGWADAVASAKPVVDFYFEKAFQSFSVSTPQGKKNICAMVFPWVAELGNEVEKGHWVRELSKRLEIREEAVAGELRKGRWGIETYRPREDSEAPRVPTRRELLEERFLALLPMMAEEARRRELENHHVALSSASYKNLFAHLSEGIAITPELQKELEVLSFKGEVLAQSVQSIEEEFRLCRRELEKEGVKDKLSLLGQEIQEKERAGNSEEITSLLRDFRTLSDELKNFS